MRCSPAEFALRRFRNVVARQQIVGDLVELVPGCLTVTVVSDDKGGPGIEFLVLLMPAGELGTNQVPNQLEQFYAIKRRQLRRLPIGLEELLEGGIVHHGDTRRHLEDPAA